jgi:3',5'-cyclic AMP phosphodiesterase CpdA
VKFIHLTDTHLVTPGRALYGTDPAWRLQQAVASIQAEHRDAAFAIVTGDLTHWGEAEAYGALREVLSGLTMRVHLLIGNHDHRGRFLQVFADDTPVDEAGFVQYAFEAGGFTHIALDSNEPAVSWGVFCERRARWLADELARSDAALPVHLYIHHPPFGVGIPAMDRIALRDSGPFREALAPHRQRIRHLFFGHLHRPMAGSWWGIPFSTLRGTNHQVALHLADSERVAGSHEPPQYAVVLAGAEQTLVHLHDFADRSARFAL